MQVQLRHALISLAIVAMAFLSHGRALTSGALGADLELFERVHSTRTAEHAPSAGSNAASAAKPAWTVADLWLGGTYRRGDVRPVPTAVLLAHDPASRSAQESASTPGDSSSVALRWSALGLLLATAAFSGFALRRALMPWIGGDTARAAGFALALLFATHPIGTAAIARPRALGDLCAMLFASLSCWLFLRGRQEREKGTISAAGVSAILAGFSSPISVLLPFVLFGLELGSTRRVRSLPERLRTATTTLVIFGACVMLESVGAYAALVRTHLDLDGLFADNATGMHGWTTVANLVEKLGILFLPVPGRADSTSWPHYLVSVALVLVAAVPVLRSARSAPRLWGWLALAWAVSMVLALVPRAGVRVEPTNYSRADVLLAASLFACMGLAVAATAQLGTRRILLPASIALGFAWLGDRAGGGFVRAGAAVAGLRSAVAAATEANGPAAHVLVFDPPEKAGGLELDLDRDGVLSPRSGGDASARSSGRRVIALPRAALPILSRTPRFAEWRANGVVWLMPTSDGRNSIAWSTRVLRPSAGDAPPVEWRADVRSPWFEHDLDPAKTRFALIVPQPGASTAEAPTLSWRTSESSGESAEKQPTTTGVWLEGETSPIAVFDLAGEDAWWTATGVRRVSTGVGLSQVDTARLLAELPLDLVEARPIVVGDDWTFEIRGGSLPRPLHGDARFELEIVDPGSNDANAAFARFSCAVEEVSASAGTLRVTARGAAGFARERARLGRASESTWSLERRVGPVVVARSSGAY